MTTVALLSLPPELTTDILFFLSHPHLRTLRLVCKSLATSPTLLRLLFHSIHLIASPPALECFTPSALHRSGIAPFVRHITFVPPLYAALTQAQFDVILKSLAENGEWSSSEERTFMVAELTRKDWDAGYAEYAGELRKVCAMLAGGQIHEQWVEILDSCRNCREFRLAMVDYSRIRGDMAPFAPPECYPNIRRRLKLVLEDALADMFDIHTEAFNKLVVSCLSQAGNTIEALEIAQPCLQTDARRSLPGGFEFLNTLDLHHLKHLTIELLLPRRISRQPNTTLLAHLQISLTTLLTRCAPTIHIFTCAHTRFLRWNTATAYPVHLPHLHTLTLCNSEISITYLSALLSPSFFPSLRTLHANGITLTDPLTKEQVPAPAWKPIFHAIRAHPILTRGEMNFTTLSARGRGQYGHMLSFDKTTNLSHSHGIEGEIPRYTLDMLPEGSDARELWFAEGEHLVDTWLWMYIEGRTEWHGKLEKFFSD